MSTPAEQRESPGRVEVRAGEGRVVLSGRLDAACLAPVWVGAMAELDRAGKLDRLDVDASGVTYCDGAGIGLLVELDRRGRASAAGKAEFTGLPEGVAQLFERARPAKEELAPPAPRPRIPTIEQIGRGTAAVGRDVAAMIAFLGEIVAALAYAIAHPASVRWKDAFLVAEKVGANAVPVVCLLGWLMGLIISFQSANPLKRLGVESTIPIMLGISMVRELGPLVTAIILAGRSGSAFAAEIGTMKVTEEVNALTTFGIEPVRYLVVPRLLAAMVTTPLLSMFATLMGLIGGYLIMITLGFGLQFYVDSVIRSVTWQDLVQGLFKAVVFAFLITAVGCVKGLRTASGPGAVGNSTTAAVVAGIVLVVAADGLLGVVFFFVGI